MDDKEFDEDAHEAKNFGVELMPRIAEQEDRRISYIQADRNEIAELIATVAKLESDFEAEVELPDLLIAQGQTRSIPARTHKYRRVMIESGGTLQIVGSAQQWCIIDCREDFVCHGNIQGTGIPFGSDAIEANAPDGQYLIHSFPSAARGGRGGSGGPARTYTRHSGPAHATGGQGARGNEKYGGGGGGGGGGPFCQACRRARAYPGNSAVDEIGGLAGQYGRGDGGDGGRSSRYRNGNLLYIHARKFDGQGASIRLRGREGAAGAEGKNGRYNEYSNSRTGGGGGGGGAPGGDGGVLMVKTKELVAEPSVYVSPGRGGIGGRGGREGLRGSQGQQGDDGSGGYVDWIVEGRLKPGDEQSEDLAVTG